MAESCKYYYDDGGIFSSRSTCLVSGEKQIISSDFFYKYCKRDYNMRDCPLYKKYGPYLSSGCFITTVVCDILGNDDSCQLLNNFRCFRDNILHSDKKYSEILQDYDNIGPMIADAIFHDKDRDIMAKGIYDNGLIPISKLIEDKKYDLACEKYYVLTLLLIKYYGLKHEYNNGKDSGIYEKDFSLANSGHGRKLIREF